MAKKTSCFLSEAAARLYMDPKSFLTAFKKDPARTLTAFSADPATYGRLRNYVGAIMLKANITRVRRILRRCQRATASSLKCD